MQFSEFLIISLLNKIHSSIIGQLSIGWRGAPRLLANWGVENEIEICLNRLKSVKASSLLFTVAFTILVGCRPIHFRTKKHVYQRRF